MTDLELVDAIIRREGGDQYTDRPADRGGPTRYGITLDTLSRWRGRACAAPDLVALSRDEAVDLYRTMFVAPWSWVADDRLREVLADWSVTSGVSRAATALQRAVGASPDGRVGPATREATTARLAAVGARLATELTAARVVFMAHAATRDAATLAFMLEHPESQLHNLNGWLARALSLL